MATMASKFSRAGLLYRCNCFRCKGTQAHSYSTVSRHEKVYGKWNSPPHATPCAGSTVASEPTMAMETSSASGTTSDPSTGDQGAEQYTEPVSDLGSEDDSSGDEILQPFEQDLFEDEQMGGSAEMHTADVNNHSPSESDENTDENYGSQSIEQSSTPNSRLHFTFLQWICILFVRIQLRFGITNAAASAIIAFISLILGVLTHPLHTYFPKNLPGVLRIASIDNFVERTVFVVCPNDTCNALYALADILGETGTMTCSAKRFGKMCGHRLYFERQLAFGRCRRTPYKTFTFIPPSVWLKKMYANKQFVSMLEEHMKQRSEQGVLQDVWDGRIWKSFQHDPTDPSREFLRNKFNIGLLVNVDWFKPFKRSEYKVAAIMLSVLNLPRRERFRKKWTMIVGIIPGPTEPKIHLNTFLNPLVDDLLCLWRGMPILPDGNVARAALLGVAADMPAARKLSQFLCHKVDQGCNICYFRAEREPGLIGAAGRMSYYTHNTCPNRCREEVLQQAEEYKAATTKTEAARVQKQYGLRWSELLRLPYFDITQMVTVDPMHTFLLGMVRNETELHISGNSRSSSMSSVNHTEFCRRLNSMHVPYDIGRLPSNIGCKDSLSGFTADQWKNYAVVYAKACLWGLISPSAYKSMCLLCDIVSLIVQPILTLEDIARLYRLLHDHHKTYCQVYGKFAVTVNYHMALHLPDIILNYGPPHAFWCFSYERMNGILASIPTNNKSIETEILERFLLSFTFAHVELPPLPISVAYHPVMTEIIAPDDVELPFQHSYSHVRWALSMFYKSPELRFQVQQDVDRGKVDALQWPIKLLHPSKQNVRMESTFMKQLEDFLRTLYGPNLQFVSPRISKFARCFVNGQMFSSDYNYTDRGSIVKALFVLSDHTLYPYFGIVRFFFEVDVLLDSGVKRDTFAYVSWFKFRSPDRDVVSKLYMVKKHGAS